MKSSDSRNLMTVTLCDGWTTSREVEEGIGNWKPHSTERHVRPLGSHTTPHTRLPGGVCKTIPMRPCMMKRWMSTKSVAEMEEEDHRGQREQVAPLDPAR